MPSFLNKRSSPLSSFFVVLLLLVSSFQSYKPAMAVDNILLNEESSLITDLKPTDVIFWLPSSGVVYSDGYISIPIKLETKQNFSLYTDKVSFLPPPGVELFKITAPATSQLLDPVSRKMVEVYTEGYFEVILKKTATSPLNELVMGVNFLGCTSKICLFPYTSPLNIKLFPTKDSYLEAEAKPIDSTSQITPAKKDESDFDLESYLAKAFMLEDISLWLLVGISLIGGILTNLTPCVYPMIPITIRVLAGQAKTPYYASSMYGAGILVTYTVLGLFAVFTGSLFGSIMASPGFNLALGLLMLLMAFSMLGFGDFSKLQQFGAKMGAGKASLKNAFFMGTGAGLVASPCTGPVLASLLTYTASKGSYLEAVVLLSTYSFGFSLPYIILGGAAAKVTRVKLSPKIQVLTKLIFGSVILALAFFYLRIPFIEVLKPLAKEWGTLSSSFLTLAAIMVFVISVSKSIYAQKFYLIGPMLALGIGIFSVSQYLTVKEAKVKWLYDEVAAFQIAKEYNRPILVDAWAEWCVACKKMDITTFQDPHTIQTLEELNYVPLKLDLTETNDKTEKLQEKYKIQGLPTLIVIPPGGDLTEMKVLGGLQTTKDLVPVLLEQSK